MKCEDCKWFEPDEEIEGQGDGRCRRLPPQFIWAQISVVPAVEGIKLPRAGTPLIDEETNEEVGKIKYADSGIWPIVEKYHWCGEFEVIENENPSPPT